jgi:hypothetical protein
MSTATDFQTQRVLSDIQSRIASLDASVTAARRAQPRPGLTARVVVARLLARSERSEAHDIAAQHGPRDHELRAAVAPAMTGVAGWAAELTSTVIADVSSTLLGPSVFGRELNAASYDLIDGAAVKAPSHQSVASGGFFGEDQPITVGALLIGAVNLQAKKDADHARCHGPAA